MHACISNGHPNLWSNFNSKNLVKIETPSFDFTKVWLKGKSASFLGHGLTKYEQIWILRNYSKVKLYRAVSLVLGLKRFKITARNIAKFGVHDCLSNGHPNLWSSFHSKKYVKSEIPSYNFVMVWLKGAENNSEHHESWHAHLSSKCTSKDMIKF